MRAPPSQVVVGGADPNVGPGGYSLGGGHSPLSALFGLSSDWIEELYIVGPDAQTTHVHPNSGDPNIDDLFWALRGGGGSTFGVVINITFTLHDPFPTPNNLYTAWYGVWEWYTSNNDFIATEVINHFFDSVHEGTFDTKWGGILIIVDGIVWMKYLYGGGTYDNATTNIAPIADYITEAQYAQNATAFDSFWDYESERSIPQSPARLYLVNDLTPVSMLNDSFSDFLVTEIQDAKAYFGGNMSDVTVTWGGILLQNGPGMFETNFSAVNPSFRCVFVGEYFCICECRDVVLRPHRDAFFVGTFQASWNEPSLDEEVIEYMQELEGRMSSYRTGAYMSEENAQCGVGENTDECEWQTGLWGDSHYEKLEKIKKNWDPKNVFWCVHCVGDRSEYHRHGGNKTQLIIVIVIIACVVAACCVLVWYAGKRSKTEKRPSVYEPLNATKE